MKSAYKIDKIEKNVAIPGIEHKKKRVAKRGRKCKYPWENMKVGDSFLLTDKTTSQISAAAGDYGRRHGKVFTVRTNSDGVRVWRVA